MKSLRESLLCESSTISNGSYTAIHGEKQRIKGRPYAKELNVLELKVEVKNDKIIFKLTNTTKKKGVKDKVIKEISKTEENVQKILKVLEEFEYCPIIPIGSTNNKEFVISNSRINGVKIMFDDWDWTFKLEDKELRDLITFFKSI